MLNMTFQKIYKTTKKKKERKKRKKRMTAGFSLETK